MLPNYYRPLFWGGGFKLWPETGNLPFLWPESGENPKNWPESGEFHEKFWLETEKHLKQQPESGEFAKNVAGERSQAPLEAPLLKVL